MNPGPSLPGVSSMLMSGLLKGTSSHGFGYLAQSYGHTMAISSQSYVLDPRPHYPLVIPAKRYWKSESPFLDDPNALTLIFTHGTGFHKEQWEPTMDDLYELLGTGQRVKVREMWGIECPNHGDGGILNEEVLKWGYDPTCKYHLLYIIWFYLTFLQLKVSWEEYARSIHIFLSGYGTGVDVNFSTRKLVGIGHSMGAVCLWVSTECLYGYVLMQSYPCSRTLSMNYFPSLKFESLILCEHMTLGQKYSGKTSVTLANGAVNRRDIWPSREEAYKLLKARPAWKSWDDRVLKIFVVCSSFYPGTPTLMSTLERWHAAPTYC